MRPLTGPRAGIAYCSPRARFGMRLPGGLRGCSAGASTNRALSMADVTPLLVLVVAVSRAA